MNKPTIFIASSKEAIKFAEAVNIKLEDTGKIRQWDNAFELSSITISKLIEKTKDSNYAVFVFHDDDKLIIRENNYSSVRDNVLFELGLFIGALGLENCFIIAPKNFGGAFRLPTDLSGITISYYDVSDDNAIDAVTSSCAKIKIAIERLEKIKSQIIEDSSRPQKDIQHIIEEYQSQIWWNRNEIEDLKKRKLTLESLMLVSLKSKLKPATPKEVKEWENGAKENYLIDVKIRTSQIFYTNVDLILPPLYGAHSLSIIVAKGAQITYGDLGHNSIYFMDGYRKVGY